MGRERRKAHHCRSTTFWAETDSVAESIIYRPASTPSLLGQTYYIYSNAILCWYSRSAVSPYYFLRLALWKSPTRLHWHWLPGAISVLHSHACTSSVLGPPCVAQRAISIVAPARPRPSTTCAQRALKISRSHESHEVDVSSVSNK
jgi:hypothetical protein